MSLVLDFNVCQSCSCKVLTFSETTGLQSDINTTGYGDGGSFTNPEVADATAATLTITIGTTDYVIDLYDTFPTSNTEFEFDLTNEDFGYTTGNKIPDQIITFLYKVTIDDVLYTQAKYFGFTCNSKCCVLSLLKNVDFCGCSTVGRDNYLTALAIYGGLEAAKDEGNITNFNESLITMKKICNNAGCGCK